MDCADPTPVVGKDYRPKLTPDSNNSVSQFWDDPCSEEFTMSGFTQTDGLYKRQADEFNNDVYYLRSSPAAMYAYRNPTSSGKNNWHFYNQLGSGVSTLK